MEILQIPKNLNPNERARIKDEKSLGPSKSGYTGFIEIVSLNSRSFDESLY